MLVFHSCPTVSGEPHRRILPAGPLKNAGIFVMKSMTVGLIADRVAKVLEAFTLIFQFFVGCPTSSKSVPFDSVSTVATGAVPNGEIKPLCCRSSLVPGVQLGIYC